MERTRGLLPRTSSDLPSRIEINPNQDPGEGHEGTALLEIVHDLAPDAELGLFRYAGHFPGLCEGRSLAGQ